MKITKRETTFRLGKLSVVGLMVMGHLCFLSGSQAQAAPADAPTQQQLAERAQSIERTKRHARAVLGEWVYPNSEPNSLGSIGLDEAQGSFVTTDDIEKVWSYYEPKIPKLPRERTSYADFRAQIEGARQRARARNLEPPGQLPTDYVTYTKELPHAATILRFVNGHFLSIFLVASAPKSPNVEYAYRTKVRIVWKRLSTLDLGDPTVEKPTSITVEGMVQKPGVYDVPKEYLRLLKQPSIAELLTMSGGLTIEPTEAVVAVKRPFLGVVFTGKASEVLQEPTKREYRAQAGDTISITQP